MDWSKYQPDWAASVPNWLGYLRGLFTEPRALFWWPTLLSALAAALLLIYLSRARRSGDDRGLSARMKPFVRELPVDFACLAGYTYTLVLMAPVLIGITIAATMLVFLAAGVTHLGGRSPTFQDHLVVAGLVFLCADFCLYWSHRLFHGRSLWLLHRLHHNPAALTPVTAFRFWPPEVAVHFAAFSFGEGIAIGVSAVLLGTAVTPLSYAGVNAFLAAWYLAFSHLRHSHVALYFPRWLSHLLVSPHMHQVHHSTDPRHHHRNFGTALAIWDWTFGTLYVPARDERFTFGVVATEKRDAAVLDNTPAGSPT